MLYLLLPAKACNGCALILSSARRFTLYIYNCMFHNIVLVFTYERAHCNAIIGGWARSNRKRALFEMFCVVIEGTF